MGQVKAKYLRSKKVATNFESHQKEATVDSRKPQVSEHGRIVCCTVCSLEITVTARVTAARILMVFCSDLHMFIC